MPFHCARIVPGAEAECRRAGTKKVERVKLKEERRREVERPRV